MEKRTCQHCGNRYAIDIQIAQIADFSLCNKCQENGITIVKRTRQRNNKKMQKGDESNE